MDAEQYTGSTFNLDAALDRLAPHYGEIPEIDSLFALNGWKEELKLISKSYRYNSKLVQSVKCNYIPSFEDNGYEALTGEIEVKTLPTERRELTLAKVDSLKLSYVAKLIDMCKSNGIELVLCYSPTYQISKSSGIEAIKSLAMSQSIPFLDYSNDVRLRDSKYFKDESHLNDTGAHVYSSLIAHEVKQIHNGNFWDSIRKRTHSAKESHASMVSANHSSPSAFASLPVPTSPTIMANTSSTTSALPLSNNPRLTLQP
jgi:hypothetical protein